MLGRENQKKYRYQLLSKEKIGKVETYKISIDPDKKRGKVRLIMGWYG